MNEAQRQAVLHGEGPLLVLAGPGSGKTFTITQRILYLVEELQVPSEEILVITFTKDAALSMQRRFAESSQRSYPVNFGTFHSIFYHILKQSGCSGTEQILSESRKKKLISPIMKKYNKAAQKDISVEDIANIVSAISYFKNTGHQDIAMGKLSEEWKNVFIQIYEEYEVVRKQQRTLDFDDMVYECEHLLRTNTHKREYWQKRFRYILMDEFQDINPMQYQVVKLLSGKPYNLFAVGDDDQAIYGFRGSEPACLRQFAEDYRAKQILLNINYRSDKEIVRTSLLVIEENKERFPKKLEAFSQERGIVQMRGFAEREEQYRYLMEQFSKMMDTHAILFRTNAYMQGFAARLKREGIPFEMKEGQINIYEHFIIKDIMAYLRLAAGERDKRLWMQILNKPSRYISREALAGGKQKASDERGKTISDKENDVRVYNGNNVSGSCRTDVSIQDILRYYSSSPITVKDFAYRERIHSSIQLLEKQLEYLKKAPPYLAVQYVWKMIGYERYLKAEKPEDKLEEFEELYQWLREDAKQYHSVEEWYTAQMAYGRALVKEDGRVNATNTSRLHLMTVHASKGLEFDHVWIPDCNEKIFPHGSMPDKETVEEERRIFYVAMTRAKKSLRLLYLTGSKERPKQPSRFLNPFWKKEDRRYT